MTSFGAKLREAREAKGVTPSDAAKATLVKVQIIDALEAEDFTNAPAPVYTKGFIRMYAEYLGLDSEPLVEEYIEEYAPDSRPLAPPRQEKKPRPLRKRRQRTTPLGKALSWLQALLDKVVSRINPFGDTPIGEGFTDMILSLVEEPWKCVTLAIGALIVIVFLVSMLTRCVFAP